MLESNEIKMILIDFLNHFDDLEFRNYLEEVEDYEMLENFCEGISIRIIEYNINKKKKDSDGNQNNIKY